MKYDERKDLIDLLVVGEISPDDHARLQEVLKSSPSARQEFRQRMDLEAGLRTWAQDQPQASQIEPPRGLIHSAPRSVILSLAIAASLLLLVAPFALNGLDGGGEKLLGEGNTIANQPAISLLGLIQEQDCTWDERPVSSGNRFASGKLSLASGVAKLSFDSGTNVVLEAPCTLDINSADSAVLLAGNVFVDVMEMSNGFTLETPEARIVDEGTQYAVALGDASAEVHVFDGSVLWIVDSGNASFQDRIESGQAKSYQRLDPTKSGFVPFGQRQFVRHLEQQLRKQAGDTLLAYDGFENIVGRMRRGRSGFGWKGGWQTAGRGRGRVAEVIAAPNDVVFESSRTGRRLLSLTPGDDIRRELENPFDPASEDALYVSLLIERLPATDDGGLGLQISLEPELIGRARRRHATSFGISTEGFPYINYGGKISRTASRISDSHVYLLVMKLPSDEHPVALRVYRPDERVDDFEPDVWTVTSDRGNGEPAAATIRISSGTGAIWQVDELRLGTSWHSVTRRNPEYP